MFGKKRGKKLKAINPDLSLILGKKKSKTKPLYLKSSFQIFSSVFVPPSSGNGHDNGMGWDGVGWGSLQQAGPSVIIYTSLKCFSFLAEIYI